MSRSVELSVGTLHKTFSSQAVLSGIDIILRSGEYCLLSGGIDTHMRLHQGKLIHVNQQQNISTTCGNVNPIWRART